MEKEGASERLGGIFIEGKESRRLGEVDEVKFGKV